MESHQVAHGVLNRREVLVRAGSGFAALKIATAFGLMTPDAARARGAPLAVFTEGEAATLGALGDVLVPGANEAGIVNFVDAEVGVPDSKLILRYMDWPPPPDDFYHAGLAALNAASGTRHQARFEDCSPEQQTALVADMAQGKLADWNGPPAPLFFFVARNDAIDVYYGTVDGFARLNVPYQQHILPPARW
jgi:hypothetical protein